MDNKNEGTQEKEKFGRMTKMLADFSHNCVICTYVDKKPNSAFEKLMRWHRTWCPVWAAHTKVYGEKPLSR